MVTTTASSSSTNLTNTLGAGSGIDIKTLAQSLVDAEKAPRKAAIDKGVSNSEKVVSGMAAVKYTLTNLQTAFDNLKDKSDFKTLSLSNSQSSAFTATASLVYLGARVAHAAVYAAGIPYVRTLAYYTGVAAEIALLTRVF